jgi:FkbM family methyltransferase
MTVRAAGYVKEFPEEREDEMMCTTGQRRRIESFVAEQGWELASLVADSGAEVKPSQSPALRRLLRDTRGIDKLVIVKLDRLGRRARRILNMLRRLEREGLELVSLEEGMDVGNKTGLAVEGALAVLADHEFDPTVLRLHGWHAQRLQRQGFAPATIIDVGVAEGTEPLYEAFPDAHLALIEPLEEWEPDLRRLVESRPGDYVLTAVGARAGSLEIQVDENPYTSSVLPQVNPRPYIERRAVPVATLDQLVEAHGWRPPFGLKVDVEGFELEVIEGAAATLEQTQFVLAEISVTERFVGACSASELIDLLGFHGFEVCDVIAAGETEMGIHADALFHRSDSRVHQK